MRDLEIGLGQGQVQLIARHDRTHFAYALNSAVPQAELARSFAGRHDASTILDIARFDRDEGRSVLWRSEGKQMLERLCQSVVTRHNIMTLTL